MTPASCTQAFDFIIAAFDRSNGSANPKPLHPPGHLTTVLSHGSTFAITDHPRSMVLSKQFYVHVFVYQFPDCLIGVVEPRRVFYFLEKLNPPSHPHIIGQKNLQCEPAIMESCRAGALGCCCYSVRMFTRNQILRIHLPIAQNCRYW